MKKHILLALLAVSLLGFASAARAVTVYADADYFGTPSGGPNGNPSGIQLNNVTTSVSSSFNLVAADGTSSFTIAAPYQASAQGTYTSNTGFTPGVDHVIPGSVLIQFFFRDPNGGAETFTVTAADFTAGSNGFSVAVVLTSNGGTAQIEGILNSTGMLTYTINRTAGEFFFDAAFLSAAVPEGGATVAMLGFGLLAIGVLRKKLVMA